MLNEEMEVTKRYLPELTGILRQDLIELESNGSEYLAKIFRTAGRPDFFVPIALGGCGGKVEDLARILRFVGARYPSLAIAMTMHNHVTGALVCKGIPFPALDFLLKKIAEKCLFSSAFSENVSGGDILKSTVVCEKNADGELVINGCKKPCTLINYADFVLVGVSVNNVAENRGLVIIENFKQGLSVNEFWTSEIFNSAGSNCVVFKDVSITGGFQLTPEGNSIEAIKSRFAVSHAEIVLSCIFQALICASYVGIASRLCELATYSKYCDSNLRLDFMSRIECLSMSIYHYARCVDENKFGANILAKAMMINHKVCLELDQIVNGALKCLGSKYILTDQETKYLLNASKCVGFHPPTEKNKTDIIDGVFS